jgi:hypothetical protein
MKKMLMVLGMVLAMASMALAQGPIITCPYTPVTPVIDGELEEAWATYGFMKEVSPSIAESEDPYFMYVGLFAQEGETDPQTDFDCSYTIYFMSNDEGIYIGATVTDNVIDAWPSSGTAAAPYYASDGLTVTFDTDNGEQEGEITIDRFMVFAHPDAPVYTRRADIDGALVMEYDVRPDIPHATVLGADGLSYTLELQVTWDELTTLNPLPVDTPPHGDMDQEVTIGWKSAVLDPDDGVEDGSFGGSLDWGSYDPNATGAESQFFFGKMIFPAHAAAMVVESSSWGQIKLQY